MGPDALHESWVDQRRYLDMDILKERREQRMLAGLKAGDAKPAA